VAARKHRIVKNLRSDVIELGETLRPGDRVRFKQAHLSRNRRKDKRWFAAERGSVGTVTSEVHPAETSYGKTWEPWVEVVWDVAPGRPSHERSHMIVSRLEKIGTRFLTASHAWLATKRGSL
jgi:hypothetical protein